MRIKIINTSRVVVFAAVLFSGCAQRPPSVRANLAIKGATLIDGTGTAPTVGTTILISDDQIVGVVADDLADIPESAVVIDGAGKYVIPGLADTHFHFGLGAPLPRHPDDNEKVLARELYYGVTSILQIGATDGSTESIRDLRERRSAGIFQSPHIYGTGGHLTLHGTHPIYTIFPPAVRAAADSLAAATAIDDPVDLYSLGIGISFVRSDESARKAVQERAFGGMDVIKITVESGPTPFGDDHPQMSVNMIRVIVDEASKYGLRVFAHVTSRDELEAVLEGGAAGVVHAPQSVPLPDIDLAKQMAAVGFTMAPTLSLFEGPEHLDDPFLLATVTDEEIAALRRPEFVERIEGRWTCCAPFDDLLANVGMLHNQGVNMVVGTDTGNPYVFAGYSVHGELELLVRAGLTPMEAIESATRKAAEMMGADDEIGTIEPGKRADLLILGANPLADIRNTRSLEVVISDGLVVDREALLEKAR